MAELRCPNCGRNNPDILEVCQFCQTPLKPESVLRIGEKPTKKHTGELESVLPDWLKDVRQQARESAEEEAAQSAAQPKSQNEPADLLAGLASQASGAEDEEVPDWLASLNPAAQPKPAPPSTSGPGKDLLAQLRQNESRPAFEPDESLQEETPSWMDSSAPQPAASEEKDELSDWFSQTAEQPEETFEFDSDSKPDAAWGSGPDSPLPWPMEPAPKEEEDLSWLRNLEEASKQTGDLKAPRKDMDWAAGFETPSTPMGPSSSQEDLSWLDSLGGIEEPSQPPSQEAAKPADDLSWLNNFGAASEPSQPFDAAPDKPISSQPPAAEEDLSWLNNLGSASEPAAPFDTPASEPSEKPFAKEDLSWLNDLGQTSEQPQPFDAAPNIPLPQEEPSWLKDLGGEPEPLSTPPFAETGEPRRQTAPLGQKPDHEATEPDWLRSATEAPGMPAPGDLSMDWFRQNDPSSGRAPSARTSQDKPAEEKMIQPEPQPAPFSDIFSAPAEPAPLSNQDVDSLFSMEMPDWLSHPQAAAETPAASQPPAASVNSEESLAPVELPSWVQAMRPVEAVISETTTSVEDEPEEKEGPLAGLRGVIPGAPIGSSIRPKPVSLKLQATEEQQSSAALLEQILGTETSPRALISSSFVASQQVLRWALAGLFLLVLSAVIILGSQWMPLPSASLPPEMQAASDALESIPENGRVLIVVDYEPSLSGEMEAVGGPLLTHMVSLRHPTLSFLSTSPNGPGLVERLMTNTNVSKPEGLGYQAGLQYFNLGYLPGGSAGVLGFIESPARIIPASEAASLSEYDALIVMTDHAESGRIWVEQLQNRKQTDPGLAGQPLLMVASAQAGPLLEPYVSSGQINGLISGLSNAARYDSARGVLPGVARSYWDTFGIGLAMAIALIVIGSLWSVFAGIRARRAEAQ